MTIQEFIERTGLNVTNEEYQTIEAVYMAAGEMDKDEFCKEYKKFGGSRLVSELFRSTSVLTGMYEERCNEIEDLHSQKREMAEFLIGKAHAYNDPDFHKEAVKMIGQKDVVKVTLVMGLPLWEEDIEYIKKNLN